ncbi:hypothetical protein FCV25MIE_11326 [Fagus crenata]
MASPTLKLISPISLILLLLTLLSQTHLSFSLRFPKSNSITTLTLTDTDVHDLLVHYGLPKGILPNNINSFSLSEDGTFTLQLTSSCYVQFDQLVYYDKKITGKLSYGAVSNVSGIQAKKLFLWVSVTGMQADKDSDMIEFYLPSLSQSKVKRTFTSSCTTCSILSSPRSGNRSTYVYRFVFIRHILSLKKSNIKKPILDYNLSGKAAAMDHQREASINGSQGMNKEKDKTKQMVGRRIIVEDERDINDLADAFIKNFRNQLKIQREESFKRFQETIARGV